MLPDEHGDVHPPPPSVEPVVVRPIQPHESRTIRRAKRMMFWTIIAGILPDLIHVVLYLVVNDSHFTELLTRWLPPGLRYAAVAVIVTYAKNQITLRKVTVAPIAGTESAREMLPLKDA